MKRILLCVLILCLVFTGCSPARLAFPAETEESGPARAPVTAADGGVHNAAGFCAGFGRADITPTNSVPLAGFGNTEMRMSRRVLDPLYVSCVAGR